MLSAAALAVALRVPDFGLGQVEVATPEPTAWVSLWTVKGEVAGEGYARQPIRSNGPVTFPRASSHWGTVTHVTLEQNGVQVVVPITSEKSVTTGDVLQLEILP